MTTPSSTDRSGWSVFAIFLRLGLTSFGGPIAHLAYFREEFVSRRQWLSEQGYADLVALCQFLPGPASSQVGIAIGFHQAGYRGALAAWLGFTLPSALALIAFAIGVSHYADSLASGVLQGLKIVAVAVVAQAVWGMGKTLCPDTPRQSLMLVASVVVLLLPNTWTQVAVLLGAGVIGWLWFQPTPRQDNSVYLGSRRAGATWLGLFFLLLIALPIAATLFPSSTLAVFDSFYRAGSLVFGGGHVVLPLLQADVIQNNWVDSDVFLAGYGATQAVPGPLFTFSAFLGASMDAFSSPWLGGMLALIAIFIPSFLLILGALPFWESLRQQRPTQAALMGVNAAVVGVLLAALYDPVWTSAMHSAKDMALGLLAFSALMFWRIPPWGVVIACAVIGGVWL